MYLLDTNILLRNLNSANVYAPLQHHSCEGGKPFENDGDNLSLRARPKMDPRLREDDNVSETVFCTYLSSFFARKLGVCLGRRFQAMRVVCQPRVALLETCLPCRLFGETCRLFGETCLSCRLSSETCLSCRLSSETCLSCRLSSETCLSCRLSSETCLSCRLSSETCERLPLSQ
jgi:hypothetical protein